MAEENKQQEQGAFPDNLWDEYNGQHVVIQLKGQYIGVTSPGVPVGGLGPDGQPQFLSSPIVAGIFRTKQDAKGNFRVTLLINDPHEEKKSKVRVDIDPTLIAIVSVTPLEEKLSIIQSN